MKITIDINKLISDKFTREELRKFAKAYSFPCGRDKSETIKNIIWFCSYHGLMTTIDEIFNLIEDIQNLLNQ